MVYGWLVPRARVHTVIPLAPRPHPPQVADLSLPCLALHPTAAQSWRDSCLSGEAKGQRGIADTQGHGAPLGPAHKRLAESVQKEDGRALGGPA